MRTLVYQVPINWRRAHFGLIHPDVTPAELYSTPVLPTNLSLFMPTAEISSICSIRDWLHDTAQANGRYSLFGNYEIHQSDYNYRSLFTGIILVFNRIIDAVQFRLTWNTQLLAA